MAQRVMDVYSKLKILIFINKISDITIYFAQMLVKFIFSLWWKLFLFKRTIFLFELLLN